MSVHVIVDGYNLIRQSAALSKFDQTDLQLGREALIDNLAAYKRIKKHKITVVFDGNEKFSFCSIEDSTLLKFLSRIAYSLIFSIFWSSFREITYFCRISFLLTL